MNKLDNTNYEREVKRLKLVLSRRTGNMKGNKERVAKWRNDPELE